MKYTIKPEYADKFIGDINNFDSDALDSLKLNSANTKYILNCF